MHIPQTGYAVLAWAWAARSAPSRCRPSAKDAAAVLWEAIARRVAQRGQFLEDDARHQSPGQCTESHQTQGKGVRNLFIRYSDCNALRELIYHDART